ncbi:hypothetical protein CCZ01_04280 [Helicobacter monodelphidis]|uniref:Opr family porin n=1 Tax=Helicobacter sp. 15-1451 TaxID=2004995 RepID=UPI000DCDAD2B|nr:Opr family porin [Helicobacter sp. 15-1451]RAX58031.1 hypothetical protein CCZ01_04280 [Helicobacter sp. 15-1451]
MNKKILWMALCLSSSCVMADFTQELEDSLKKGSASGHLGIYGQLKNFKETQTFNTLNEMGKGSAYLSPSASIVYESSPLHFVSLGAGVWSNIDIYEKNKGDYDGAFGNAEGILANNSTAHQLFVKAEHPGYGFVKVGRQDVNLEWLTDYIQGAVINLTPMDGLSITAGWAGKHAVVDFDEVSVQFTDTNASDGVYVADIQYKVGFLTLNPYYYFANHLVQIPGAKVGLEIGNEAFASHTLAHYALSNVDTLMGEDGSYLNVEETITLPSIGFHIGAGYAQVDKKGSGLIETFGDQSRLEEGNHYFDPNAKTIYGFIGYSLNALELSALYAQTKYDVLSTQTITQTENEINAGIGYEFFKGLSGNLLYAHIKNDIKAESYDVFKAKIAYEF